MHELPIKKLKFIFSRHPEINTAVLFGSYSKGRNQKKSDVDIAILLNHYRSVPWKYKSKLMDEVEKVCDREVDLLILNEASPHIAYRAVKEGKILFQKNQSFWSQFVVKTISMNEDMEILYRKVGRG